MRLRRVMERAVKGEKRSGMAQHASLTSAQMAGRKFLELELLVAPRRPDAPPVEFPPPRNPREHESGIPEEPPFDAASNLSSNNEATSPPSHRGARTCRNAAL